MVGQTVGSYTIKAPIGKGGMGAVFLGIDNALERPVAIKVLSDQVTQDAVVLQRFRTEAITLARLSHPNIASVYNFFQADDKYMLVMELVEGETLEQVLRRLGPLKPGEAAFLVGQALNGLAHAHSKGIVHRDIKPANLMLAHDGVVKITDFGIARIQGSTKMTSAGKIVGTPEYMSPEQIQWAEVDARSDIYSMGIVLYELLTGRSPFSNSSEYEVMRCHVEVRPPSVRDQNPKVSAGLDKVLQKSMAKKPQDRYQSAMEFRAALAPFVTPHVPPAAAHTMAEGVPAYVPSKSGPRTPAHGVSTKDHDQPRKTPVGLYAGIAAVIVIGGGLWAVMGRGSGQASTSPPGNSPAAGSDPTPPVKEKTAAEQAADKVTDAGQATDDSSKVQLLLEAKKLDPSNSEAKSGLTTLATKLEKKGEDAYGSDKGKAKDLWLLAIQADPANELAHLQLAALKFKEGDIQGAKDEIHLARQLKPDDKVAISLAKMISGGKS